jgi:NAD(P)-dependent dehydrogenase (short-subunit alcohol dehydrogenase family)
MDKNMGIFGLNGKVAIVTGSGSGIGRGISLMFATAGADIVLAEIDEIKAQETAEAIQKYGRKALVIVTDMLRLSDVDKVVQKTMGNFGKIDILANVVGGTLGLRRPALELNEESWDKVVAFNLKTVFLGSTTVAKAMINHKLKGSIINISSIAGFVSYPHVSHYAAAKAGVINLTKTLAAEWAQYGIRVNAIAPSFIDTPLFQGAAKHFPGWGQNIVKRIPLERIGTPEDIAATAVYLASDASSFVTGQTIRVDGGVECLVYPGE